jgi:hypothetical protein
VRRFAAFALLVMAAAAAAAESPSVRMTLEPKSLAPGQTATLRVELPGGFHLRTAPDLQLKNLEIVQGPSIENRFQWINGKSSSQTILLYGLQPLAPGPASVGPVHFAAPTGEPLVAPRIAVEVAAGMAGPPAELAGPGARSTDPALVSRLDPPNPIAGQQAIWTLYLLTRGQATRAEVSSLPDFRGFWAEDLERDSGEGSRIWTLDGVPWRAYPLLRKALFPIRPGPLSIGSAEATVSVRSDVFDVFGDPFGEGRSVRTSSAPLPVVSRPSPPDAAALPVGRFSFSASLDRTKAMVGESVTLSAALSGDGRLSDAAPPSLNVEGARVSAPESRLTLARAGRLTFTRTWQWLLTPTRAGTVSIQPLSIGTYDPTGRRIRLLRSDALAVAVTPLPTAAAPAAAEPPLAALPAARDRTGVPRGGAAAGGAAVLALLLLGAGFLLGRRRARGPAPAAEATNPEAAAEELLGRLAEALAEAPQERWTEYRRLRDELDAARYAPELSSREEAAREIADRVRKTARRWKVRL